MGFLITILVGMGLGLIVFPIGLWLFLLIINTKERRKIKKLIKQGKFLITIDPKDYDVKAWTNQKYGNIDQEKEKIYLDNLNTKIFKKVKLNKDNEFLDKVTNYLINARKLGYSDEMIKEEFKKKNYSDDLIKQVFEING